jgi:tyrocidine synthetase-3
MSKMNVPIGKPISNFRFYILDNNDQLVPLGVPGEICIGGDVTAEDLQQPAEIFDHPFRKGERMYRTGELGRWRPDGSIACLGKRNALTPRIQARKNTAASPIFFEAPRNALESALLQIWKEVLGKDRLSVHDDFFELGGHSLKAVQLVARIRKSMEQQVKLNDIFLHTTLAAQAVFLSETAQHRFKQIPRVARQQSYPLSHAQHRFWMLSQFEESSQAYHISNAIRLEGPFDKKMMDSALAYVINRHESLRTVFQLNENGEIRQQILASGTVTCIPDYFDISTAEHPEAQLKELFNQEQLISFDLTCAPLLRVKVIRISEEEHALFYTLHHIIADGWSIQVLARDMVMAYNAFKTGNMPELPVLDIQYKDYAAWQLQHLQGDTLQELEDYWLHRFEDGIPVLDLPVDYPRPAVQRYRGSSLLKQIPADTVNALRALCRQQKTTLFTGLLAALNGLLYRYTGQEDIMLGTPIGGREHVELEDQIGLYLNTLALRTQIEGTDSFETLLAKEKEILLGAYTHQAYPFNMLADRLNIKRNVSRSLLFDVMVVLQNQEDIHLAGNSNHPLQGLSSSQLKGLERQTSQVDLTFTFTERGEELQLQIGYNREIFKEETILRLYHHFIRWLQQVTTSPQQPLNEVKYLTGSEVHQQLFSFNHTTTDYPSHSTIADMFEAQAAQTPDAIALVFEDKVFTYRALNEQANRLAHYLQEKYTIRPDDLIGIMMERSELMMIAILGILKSGAAYLPVDSHLPVERAGQILRDAAIDILLASSDAIFDMTEYYAGEIFAPDMQLEGLADNRHNPERHTTAAHLSYVMYTSGSTGKPKGVMVEHRSVLRLVKSANFVSCNAGDVLLSTGAVSFDAVTFEYWGMLLNGGRLVLVRQEDLLDYERLHTIIKREGVNMMWFTASWFNQLVEVCPNLFATLSVLLVGGDRLSPHHISKLLHLYPSLTIINGYGPTENTTFSATHLVTETGGQDIPIGTPISNSTAYILDDNRQLLPLGAKGELYVGGDGMARGYLHAPALTRERFIAHPFQAGERLYRTGDICRYRPDGVIVFIGRKDHQVKIRGYRVEPEEIAAVMAQVAGITKAVVEVVPAGTTDKVLVAWYTKAGELSREQLVATMNELLPDYMVPAHFIEMEKFPLNRNGKINTAALPVPEMDLLRSREVAYMAPRNATEAQLVCIWEDILERKDIGVHENFFELGGHSLKAIQLVSRIRKELLADVQIKDVFNHPQLSALAGYIGGANRHTFEKIPQVAVAESYPLSNGQLRFWVLSRFTDSSLAYNMAQGLLLKGSLQAAWLKKAVETTVHRHESLRTVFKQQPSGEIRQYIIEANEAVIAWEYTDISGLIQPDAALKDIYAGEQLTPFDLEKGPLLRIHLVKITADTHAFFYTMHHIISDGWSMQVLAKEVINAYNIYSRGAIPDLPPLQLQYKDYAGWLQSQLEGEALQQQEQYWMQQMAGELPVLNLFAGKMRPPMKTHRGRSIRTTLMNGRVDVLQQFCKAEGVTVFMVLLAGIKALLYRYTGLEDIIAGIPIAGREQQELEDQIGIYLNTLALRTRFAGTDSFSELLAKEKEVLLGAYSHQAYPFDRLVEKLKLNRDISRTALFDVLVVLQNQGDTNVYDSSIGFDGLTISNLDIMETETSQFDLTFFLSEQPEGIQLRLAYNPDIFEPAEMERLCTHYGALLSVLIDNPATPVCTADYLSTAEKNELLIAFNNNHVPLPEGITFLDIWSSQVQAHGAWPAIVHKHRTATYAQLDMLANTMAQQLYVFQKIKKEDLVVILLDRSIEMVAAILATWKCGAAYVPVDPEYPRERINAIIEGAAPALIISNELLIEKCGLTASAVPLLDIDQVPATTHPAYIDVPVTPAGLAYVIFTSGSTGKPKGVMIEHAGMLNHLYAKVNDLDVSANTVICQNASQSFDISVWQFFTAFMAGGKTVIISNQDIMEPAGFIAHIIQEKISILELVPSYLSLLLDILELRNEKPVLPLKNLVVTGETLSAPLVKKWFSLYPHIPMVNAYGPTEASDDITHHIMKAAPDSQHIPIGKPVQNMQLLILDAQQQLCPVGVAGEIYVTGIGVGRGYLNDAAKTAAAFLPNPFSEHASARMYKTGDAGKFLPDGSIAFYGRKDQQVKIRGNRIELDEIESHLIKHPEVKDAAVLAQEAAEGKLLLIAYVVTTAADFATGALRAYLSLHLPDYMVPAYIVPIESMPLTANGKTDRKGFPALAELNIIEKQNYVLPENAIEEQLVAIWDEVLGWQGIGVKDNFFELGGHSLGVVRILNAVQLQFDVKVDMKELFESPTIRQLAQEINLLTTLQESDMATNNDHNKEIII